MGESIMAASNHEHKMGETGAASDRSLEVSVSFGRFENDSLSWEKWSSFSANKYLEEVEKCATPGSVAMKKAYFEAHYKKIAASKAEVEQLGQEKQMGHESPRSNDQNGVDSIGNTHGTDSEFDASNAAIFDEGTRQEADFNNGLDTGHIDEPRKDDVIDFDDQGISVESVQEESSNEIDGATLNKLKEAPLVKEGEIISMESQEMNELSKNLTNETESIPAVKVKNAKLNPRKEPQKITPMGKIKDVTRVKKKSAPPAVTKSASLVTKSASPVTKSPQISTPKVTKPVPISSTLSTSQSSVKKATGSSLVKSKSPSVARTTKVAPKSLHMSLSMDTPNTPTSVTAPLTPAHPTTVRTSFIMEKMKDKEIVKRAFKTFQNNFNQLKSSAEQRLSAKQVQAKGTEAKVSSSITPRKENAGSPKVASMDKKTAKAAPSSLGLRSDERADKRKEFSKKLEAKANAKEAESTRSRAKSKEEKDTDIRKLRQSVNFKASPMPGFYRGQNVSKSPLDKEGSKSLRI